MGLTAILLVSSFTVIIYLFDRRIQKSVEEFHDDSFSRELPYSIEMRGVVLTGILISIFSVLPEGFATGSSYLMCFGVILMVPTVIIIVFFYLDQLSLISNNFYYSREIERAEGKREKHLIFLYHYSKDYRVDHWKLRERKRRLKNDSVCEICKSRLYLEYEFRDLYLDDGGDDWGATLFNKGGFILLCEKHKIKRFEKYLSQAYFDKRYMKISELSSFTFKK